MPDEVLIVAVTTGRGVLLGCVPVTIDATGDDLHDAMHAILEASHGISEGGLRPENPGAASGAHELGAEPAARCQTAGDMPWLLSP